MKVVIKLVYGMLIHLSWTPGSLGSLQLTYRLTVVDFEELTNNESEKQLRATLLEIRY